MTDATMKPLYIEIYDGRNISVFDAEGKLGYIVELKLHMAVDMIPPILEVTVPEISPDMNQSMKDGITHTSEVMMKHGIQVRFRPQSEFSLAANPAEQSQAERSLKEQLIPPKG